MPRKCRGSYHKEWRERNPDKVKEYNNRANKKRDPVKVREYNTRRKHKSPEKWLLWVSRARAKKRGIEHTITEEDIVIPDKCPVLGIEIGPNDGCVGPSSLTLDRLNPSKGYVPGNIKVISHRANQLKSDMSIEDVRNLLRYMEENCVS